MLLFVKSRALLSDREVRMRPRKLQLGLLSIELVEGLIRHRVSHGELIVALLVLLGRKSR